MKKAAGNAELKKEQEILQHCRVALEDGRPLRTLQLGSEDAKRLRGFQFLSAKPLLLVLNLDEADLPSADRAIELAGMQDVLKGARHARVPICAKIELEIAQLEASDARAFMADLGLKESGLDRVIRASYDLLGYISFFTVGEDECRAWSIPRGTPAQTGGRRNPHRHSAGLHPRRSGPLRAPAGARNPSRPAATMASFASRARIHRARRRRHQLPTRHVIRFAGSRANARRLRRLSLALGVVLIEHERRRRQIAARKPCLYERS